MPRRAEKPYTPPDRSKTRQIYADALPAWEEALQLLSTRVRNLLEKNGLTPTIKQRVKGFGAYHEKLQRSARKRQGPPAISDFFGLRIICPFLEDVTLIEALLREEFVVVETERKAAEHSFREFGYDSVHLLIRCDEGGSTPLLPHTRRVAEIQLRTILQDAWAEVEHELVYKSSLAWPNESIRRKLAALNATLTLSDLTFQEIRDYQSSVRRLNHKRRTALEQALALPVLANPEDEAAPAKEEPSPLLPALGSPLEKAMLKALEAHSHQQFERAVELYGGILSMHLAKPIRALIYNHRGMALFALGRQREALRDFTRAIDYDPGNLRALCNRGLVFRLEKRHARALEDFDQAVGIDPSACEALLGRAQLYLELRFPDRALLDCRRALEIAPELGPALALEEKIRRQFFTG